MQRLQEKEGEFLKENQIEGKIIFFSLLGNKKYYGWIQTNQKGFPFFLLFCIISPPLFKKIYMDWVVEL